MTEMQLAHHEEQMEALRKEFLESFEDTLWPLAHAKYPNAKREAVMGHLWDKWKEAHRIWQRALRGAG